MKKLLTLIALIPTLLFGQTTPDLTKVTNAGNTSIKIIKYNANHGIQFDARTLTDKGYVDSVAALASGVEWKLLGNASTVDGTNFLGNIDNVPLSFRVHNVASGRIDKALANSFFGYSSGLANTTGFNNTAHGAYSLLTNSVGVENTAIGEQALRVSTGSSNTGIGTYALFANTTGSSNTALGSAADVGSGALTNATAIGANTTVNASNTMAFGDHNVTQFQFNGALMPYYSSAYNAGTGGQVLTSQGAGVAPQWATATSGWGLTGNAGTTAGTNFLGTTDAQDVVIKTNSVEGFRVKTTGQIFCGQVASPFNLFIGQSTGTSGASGINNVGVGNPCLGALTSGYRNTALGNNALQGTTSGFQNVAVGERALLNNTSGAANVAVGHDALTSNIAGTGHTAIGESALTLCSGGSLNTAVGYFAANNVTTGTGNCVFGYNALNGVTTADQNVAIGSRSLSLGTGSYNIGLGFEAGRYETGSNALYIHNSAGVTTEATGKTNSIIYGVMASTPATQTLRFNAAVGINVAPSSSVTHLINGFGATSATYGLKVHNSTGTNNALMVRDDGNVGIGTSTPVGKLHINQATTNTNVQRLVTDFAGAVETNPTWDIKQGAVLTTTTTATTLQSYTLTVSEMMFFETTVTVSNGADVASYVVRATYKYGATPTLIGLIQQDYVAEAAAFATCDVTFDATTTGIVRVRVTGINDVLDWHCTTVTQRMTRSI